MKNDGVARVFELPRDPLRPAAVGVRVADEEVGGGVVWHGEGSESSCSDKPQRYPHVR